MVVRPGWAYLFRILMTAKGVKVIDVDDESNCLQKQD
jgi:hypothetical protein